VRKSQVKEGLNLQYRQARNNLESAHDRFKNAKANRDLTGDVYEISQEKFREGLISSLELTQAHNQYLNSESEYLQALTDLLSAETELEKVLEIL
jgi:outer membrane protein TolC